jgi:hypothetical protein
MKIKSLTCLAVAALALTACDDTTDTIGNSMSEITDNLAISTDTFLVSTRSVKAGSVLSKNTTAYLGKIRDPETNAYITGDGMIQFNTLVDEAIPGFTIFPPKDNIIGKENNQVVADSCNMILFFDHYYGDSLRAMTMTAYEMARPMEEGTNYYSDFDPMANGFVRTNGLQQTKVYSLFDSNVSESERSQTGYMNYIKINLDKPYTDKDGATYNNYGTYIMRKYYENPNYFKNSYSFIHNVVPGFYFKNTSGLGSMAYVSKSQINVYYRFNTKDSLDKVYRGSASFPGTEEVLQTTNITNDANAIDRLVADNSCTYLKTPAGIFTEATLPVDEIMQGHDSENINTAKVVFTRINNTTTSKYSLGIPKQLLMIPAAEINSFFEQGKIPDSKTSFVASYDSKSNTYTFGNIAGMITAMDKNREAENWNKVVLIPVSTTQVQDSSTGLTVIQRIVHDMSLTSTKLVGGSQNPYAPITISVIYSKFK